ncbi:hypothetical protein NQ315_013274 [Exocentrus adspersus]|uniref:protein phosphatase methylesterase-1 n=1 Tax=Exocentrus adspersus TaxID=1586481 RepID=A0AAV8VLV3_9CUCU|nr:hypothetical protein NQ315_013274 [Exocentrus adspersus]
MTDLRRSVLDVHGRRSGLGSSSKLDYTPIRWSEYFDSEETIITSSGNFHVYSKGHEGPILLCLHGGGYSGLTWALFAAEMFKVIHCQIKAVDLRGHGNTHTDNDYDLALDRMTYDIVQVGNALAAKSNSPIILVGHSMGGAVAVESAYQIPSVVGLCVIDVVEGTAMDALSSMQRADRLILKAFLMLSSGVLKGGQTHNLEAARVSMPGQIVNMKTNKLAADECEEIDMDSIDLASSNSKTLSASSFTLTEVIEEVDESQEVDKNPEAVKKLEAGKQREADLKREADKKRDADSKRDADKKREMDKKREADKKQEGGKKKEVDKKRKVDKKQESDETSDANTENTEDESKTQKPDKKREADKKQKVGKKRETGKKLDDKKADKKQEVAKKLDSEEDMDDVEVDDKQEIDDKQETADKQEADDKQEVDDKQETVDTSEDTEDDASEQNGDQKPQPYYKPDMTPEERIAIACSSNYACRKPPLPVSSGSSSSFKIPTNVSKVDEGPQYTWRIDLSKTEKFWTGWFKGLSHKFLELRVPKILLLANIHGLDTALTVGQMQGKFQLQVLAKSGHAIHEDQPHNVAEILSGYLVKQKLAKPKADFVHSLPAC